MLKREYSAFIGCDAEIEEADAVIFGAPFDSTTSFRPGARGGPSAMRRESFGIETYSPYQDSDITDKKIADAGDLELPFGSPERPLAMIEETAQEIFDAGKRSIMFGGEHTVTLGAVCAAARRWPDLRIVHFDAHADLRDEYLGVSRSHACVMRRCWEIVGDGRIYQFCIRSGEREEFRFAAAHTKMTRYSFDGLDGALAEIGDAPIYLTIDLDCLDLSIFPGTGTPEAGGVSFQQMHEAMLKVCRANVVASDLVELAPNLDASGTSTAVACKAARELILAVTKEK